MSQIQTLLSVFTRDQFGTASSRRLRSKGQLPGMIHQKEGKKLPITLSLNQVLKILKDETLLSQLITLKVGQEEHSVILKELQRHPYKKLQILHMDFQEVETTKPITVHVALRFEGEATCPGIKAGGMLHHELIEIPVRCLPMHLPEAIIIDVSKMGLDTVLKLSQIKLPEEVESLDLIQQKDPTILSIHKSTKPISEENEAAPEATS